MEKPSEKTEYPTDFCKKCGYGKVWGYNEKEIKEKGGLIPALICGFECLLYYEQKNPDKIKELTKKQLKNWKERKETWKKINIIFDGE